MCAHAHTHMLSGGEEEILVHRGFTFLTVGRGIATKFLVADYM